MQNPKILARIWAAILNHDVSGPLNAKFAFVWYFSHLYTSYLFFKTQNLKIIHTESICRYFPNNDQPKNANFCHFWLFFQKITHKTNNEPRLTYINNFIGSLSIQNMGKDTKIRPLALMKAKILKYSKIMAAILKNGVCREG